MRRLGFEPIYGWECLYKHPSRKVFVSIYVDDFQVAGNATEVHKTWIDLGKVLDLDPPVTHAECVYLGYLQKSVPVDIEMLKLQEQMYGTLFADHDSQIVDSTETAPVASQLRKREAKTAAKKRKSSPADKSSPGQQGKKCHVFKDICFPSLHMNSSHDSGTNDLVMSAWKSSADAKDVSYKVGECQAFEYSMQGQAQGAVKKYLERSGKSEKDLSLRAETPCIDDHQLRPEQFEVEGELASVAVRIVLTALYLARVCRPDIMYSVCMLAREVTRWKEADDKRLHRLMSYLHNTSHYMQKCFVGNSASECQLALFCDASFAGCLQSSKSTSGVFCCIVGPRTFMPVTWLCKKQSAISHSSTEAELISLDTGLRVEGIPLLGLWSEVLQTFHPELRKKPANLTSGNSENRGKSMLDSNIALELLDYVPPSLPEPPDEAKLFLLEDNDAVLKMIRKGRSAQMRHVGRVHRVNIDWLFERCANDKSIRPRYVNTEFQLADLLTKGSFTAATWKNLLALARMGETSEKSKHTGNLPARSPSKSTPVKAAVVQSVMSPRLRSIIAEDSKGSGGNKDDTPRPIAPIFVAP